MAYTPIDFKETSSVCLSVKVLSTPVYNSIAAVETDMWCHVTYNLRGAWHTVYAMLLSYCKWDATWNSFNRKVQFSLTYNSFSNNSVLYFTWIIFMQGYHSTFTSKFLEFFLNLLYTDRLFHCYMLDKSSWHFRGVRSILSLLFYFWWKSC